MSLVPKSRWTDWARDWGLQHVPQKGWMYRDERIVGLRDGRIVQVGWGGDKNASLVVLIRFPRVENVQGLRDTLIADPALDAMPGKGAGRRKMARASANNNAVRLGAIPEYTLGERSLVWIRRFAWRAPKPAEQRAWVETLLGAVGRATPKFDGRCESCSTGSVSTYVLVDGVPMMLCGSCRQRMRAEGEMAERAYDMQDASHATGALFALGASFAGAVVWALLEMLTGRIFAALAIGIGALVAWAYRKGAGRVDGVGRVIAGVLTLGAVVMGDVLIIAISMMTQPNAHGFPLLRAFSIYGAVAAKSPGSLVPPLLFGLVGVWFATKALARPKLKHDIREAGEDPRVQQKKAA